MPVLLSCCWTVQQGDGLGPFRGRLFRIVSFEGKAERSARRRCELRMLRHVNRESVPGTLNADDAKRNIPPLAPDEKSPHGDDRKGLIPLEPAWRLELQTY